MTLEVSLMNSLKLKSIDETDVLNIFFWKYKTKQKTAPAVERIIKTKISNDIKMKAMITKKITGPLQIILLKLKNQKNLQQHFKLVDTLPS